MTTTRPAKPDSGDAPAERVLVLRPRTVLVPVGVLLGVTALVGLVFLAQQGLTLILVALFLALALNPAVEFFQRRGMGRGLAVATVSILVVVFFGLLAAVFVPPLVTQITHFGQPL